MNPTDPLQDLRDIHLPEPLAWQWAPGWWLLGLLILGGAVAACLWWLRRHRRQAFRREALAMLTAQQQASDLSPLEQAQALTRLLKRVAISRYGREEAAGLSGQAWLAFLDQTGNTDAFTQGPGRALGDDLYRPDTEPDVDALFELCLNWIRRQ